MSQSFSNPEPADGAFISNANKPNLLRVQITDFTLVDPQPSRINVNGIWYSEPPFSLRTWASPDRAGVLLFGDDGGSAYPILQDDTKYTWYVQIVEDGGGTFTGPTHTFTIGTPPPSTPTLDSVDLYMGLSSARSGWNVVVSIYAFANYSISPNTGVLLGSKAIDVSNVPRTVDGPNWVNFTFDTPIDISTNADWIGVHVTTTAPSQFARAPLRWYESSEFEVPEGSPYTGTEKYWYYDGSWILLATIGTAYKLNTTDCDSNDALTPNASYRSFSGLPQQGIRSYLDTSTLPTKAENPTPADEATNVDFFALGLSWDDGGGADTFDVYMGPVGALVLVSSAQAETTFTVDTEDIPWGETIYWRIDSTNGEGTTTGDTWSFDVVVIRSVKLGANGAFIVVAAKDGVYLSTDSGTNWSRKTPDDVEDTDWEKGICSSGGTYIIVVSNADAIYRSANSGSSWAQITPAGGDTFSVNKMATSDDGQFMVIVGQNSTDDTESCYISTDYGATWTAKKPVAASIEYIECDISNDGTVIAVSTTSNFYISFDSGSTWIEQGMASTAEVWKGLSISGDGTTGLVANTNDNNEFFIGINTELFSKATWAESIITSVGRALLDDATVADQNTTLGFGTEDSPILTGLTLSSLAESRVVFAGASGLFVDDPGFTFSSNTLFAPNITASGTVQAGAIIISDDGYIGSVGEPTAIQIDVNGNVVLHNDLDVANKITTDDLDVEADMWLRDIDGPAQLFITFGHKVTNTPLETGPMGYWTGDGVTITPVSEWDPTDILVPASLLWLKTIFLIEPPFVFDVEYNIGLDDRALLISTTDVEMLSDIILSPDGIVSVTTDVKFGGGFLIDVAGTDAVITMDGSGTPGTLTYESDNGLFLLNKNLQIGPSRDGHIGIGVAPDDEVAIITESASKDDRGSFVLRNVRTDWFLKNQIKAGTTSAFWYVYGQSFPTTGKAIAASSRVEVLTGVGGLGLSAVQGPLKFWTGGSNLRGSVDINGVWSFGTPGTNETTISATGSITQAGTADATLNLTTSSTQTEWDDAFANMVEGIAFNTGDGIITVTQQDSGTLTTDSLDGRYYTETELGSISNGVGASLIGVEDAMALYTATNVEDALEEVMDQITIVTHVADSFEVGGDQVGTVTGIIENTQVINDGDELILNETTGGPNPNFVQTFEFSGITAGHEPNLIELHWYYSPITTPHTLSIQMFNYNTSTWDVIDNTTFVATGGTLTFSSITIIDGGGAIVDYTSGGAARVRFSHDDNGISSHDFGIDYLAIKDDHGIGSGITDHGSLSGLQDDDHDPLYHTDGRAATWLAANHETTFTHGDIATNTSKVTNATHTGEVIGLGALTAQPVMITGKDAATVASGDLVLVSDINDSNILKKVTAQSIGDLGGGGGDKNADGGFANSTYIAPQSIDGGNA